MDSFILLILNIVHYFKYLQYEKDIRNKENMYQHFKHYNKNIISRKQKHQNNLRFKYIRELEG